MSNIQMVLQLTCYRCNTLKVVKDLAQSKSFKVQKIVVKLGRNLHP